MLLCHSALLLRCLLSGLESLRHLHFLELTSASENQYDMHRIFNMVVLAFSWSPVLSCDVIVISIFHLIVNFLLIVCNGLRYYWLEIFETTLTCDEVGWLNKQCACVLYMCVCAHLHSCSCKDKFVQECGVARLWEVAMFDFLLFHN